MARSVSNGVLKFHAGTEEKLLSYVLTNAEDSNPDSVIECINKFCWTNHWMMHVGDEKGKILEKTVYDTQPLNVLELGTYCGYSTILMLKNMTNPESKVYCVDPDTETIHKITIPILRKAGLLSRVVFILECSDSAIQKFNSKIKFDLVFLDHDKKCYYVDLITLEQKNLLNKDIVLVADNVIVFKIMNYYNYVTNKNKFKTEIFLTNLEYNNETTDSQIHKDGILVSRYK
jgi:catechol O-methyltransferase